MKYLYTLTLLCLIASPARSQTIDTMINTGNYRLQFHIVKGKGMPILFEDGSGGDGSNFEPILQPIHELTGATLITYARAGFGRSELDNSNHDLGKHGILQGIEGLERALKRLGYDHDIMLVAASYGGFCATLYAARNPEKVKAAVYIDANPVGWFTDGYVNEEMKVRIRDSAESKKKDLAQFYQSLNLRNTVDLLRKKPFPANIPVIDLVSVFNFPDSIFSARWATAHREFAAARPNRQGITAYGCHHLIFRDNPTLVIAAIVKEYAGTLGRDQGYAVMQRFVSFSLREFNIPQRK